MSIFAIRKILVALVLLYAGTVPVTAWAVDITDIEAAIDDTGVFAPYSLVAVNTLVTSCSDASDLEACIDASAEYLPPEEQTMINIILDLENKDYTQLLQDGGETVFCAAMKIITDVDVCGILKDLEALPADVAAVAGSAANAFVCDLNIGGIICADDGSKGMGHEYDNICEYAPGQWIPKADTDSGDPNSCAEQICSPGEQICGATGSKDGQCYCSTCPAGQALQGGVCGACATKSGSELAQSSDKRSWTRTNWSESFAASFDGSHCLETGGTSNQQVWNCPPGQIAPEYGKCERACPIGQVFAQGACTSCPNGYASYEKDGSSIGACLVCAHGMQSVDGGAACACPTGYGQENAASECNICPANSYANFAICSLCDDQSFSAPGSTYCKKLACPPGSHAMNHICAPDNMHLVPGGVNRSGPAVINKSCVAGTHADHGRCVPDGFSKTPGEAKPIAEQGPCPPLSRWTGKVCIGPRGKHFCPDGLTLNGGTCIQGLHGAPPRQKIVNCPVLSHVADGVCIGPRGKHFCPEGWAMRDGTCVH